MMESWLQIGHRRRMPSALASAQSVSRLYCVAESEINRIVTLGAPLIALTSPRSECEDDGAFTSQRNPDWKRISHSNWALAPAGISRLIAGSSRALSVRDCRVRMARDRPYSLPLSDPGKDRQRWYGRGLSGTRYQA